MQYQSFPDAEGDSRTRDKLKALRLPPLAGKSFLDVGCNEGYFCGYAAHHGASRVVGLDRSLAAVQRARARFPECEFLAQSWDSLPDGKFDVILLASALHYAADQPALIERLVNSLTPLGVLVLEIGLANSTKNEWVSVVRSIDERLFPSRAKLSEVLEPYAWKIIGRSVEQAGDPVGRIVVQVGPMRPYAFTLLDKPGSGKTTLCRRVFRPAGLEVISGDWTYQCIAQDRVKAPAALRALVTARWDSTRLSELTQQIIEAGLLAELFDVWCDLSRGKDFVIDSYLPDEVHDQLKQHLIDRGFIPASFDWTMDISMASVDEASRRANGYERTLRSRASKAESQQRLALGSIGEARRLLPDLKWHVDGPSLNQPLLNAGTVILSGWVLHLNIEPGSPVRCFVRNKGRTVSFVADRLRPDVVQAVFGKPATADDPLVRCGFRFELSDDQLHQGMEFGFVVDGKEIPIARMKQYDARRSGLIKKLRQGVSFVFGKTFRHHS